MMTTERVTISAGHGKAGRFNAGQSLEPINTPGTRVVDFRAFDAYDLREYMCVEASRIWRMPLWPTTGDVMATNQRRPIVTLDEDTTPGIHDTIMAACDRQRQAVPITMSKSVSACSSHLSKAFRRAELYMFGPSWVGLPRGVSELRLEQYALSQ